MLSRSRRARSIRAVRLFYRGRYPGAFTDIAISSPDIVFTPVSGLPAVGSLPTVPGNTGTFVITVSYKDNAQKVQRIKRNTSVTVSPLPLPSIAYFKAQCDSDPGNPDSCGLKELPTPVSNTDQIPNLGGSSGGPETG